MEARKKFYEWALNCSILTVSTIFITGLVEGTSSFLELYYPVCSVHSKLFHQTMNCFWHLNYWMRSLQRDFTIVLLSWVSYVDCWYDKNLFFTNGTFFEMDGSIWNTKARMSEPSRVQWVSGNWSSRARFLKGVCTLSLVRKCSPEINIH